MNKVALLAAAAVLGGSVFGFASNSAVAAPSLCDSIAGNLVANCGFETGNFSGWAQGGNTGHTSVNSGSEHTGSFGVDEGPVGSDGILSQVITTAAGLYHVAVWFQSSGSHPSDFNVTFAGVEGINLVNPAQFSYTEFSFDATSPGGAQTLQIGFRNDPSFDQFDDISVTAISAVPEPATLALFGAGLLGLGLARRRMCA